MFSNQFEMAAAHRLLAEWRVSPLARKIIFQLVASAPIPAVRSEVVVQVGPLTEFLSLPAPALQHIRGALAEAEKPRTMMNGSRLERGCILERSRVYGEGKFVGYTVNQAFINTIREQGRHLAAEDSVEYRPTALH